jgi:VRR-NUC domain-containing protein
MTVKLFMGRDPSVGKWAEHEIQAYVVQEARRLGYFIEGDQNAAKRGYGAAARAKACGMTAGTPDLRVMLPRGDVLFIELKLEKGRLSDSQKAWHKRAEELRQDVIIVFADTPQEAWTEINSAFLNREG